MNLSPAEIDTLKYEAESMGMSWHEHYTGHYNVIANYAIAGSYIDKINLVLNFISMLKYAAIDGEVDEAEGYENIVEWLLNAREDQLGNGYIWY